MMDSLISGFAAQLDDALQIASSVSLSPLTTEVHHVYVAGMGGSGIGADFVRAFVSKDLEIPYITGKGYAIPAYVGPHTLFIASSYSGNTEETLHAAREAHKAGARIVCVSSGGELQKWAKQNHLDFVLVPGGSPSPRACLGYSIVAQLAVLRALQLTGEQQLQEVRSSIQLLEREAPDIQSRAEMTARFVDGKLPVIYAADTWGPVCLRFRQQINENAKLLAWHHVLPEMNHNELVGWRDRQPEKAVIILRSRSDDLRTKQRLDITKGILSERTDTLLEIYTKGSTYILQTFYLVHYVDWVSWYLAGLHGVDSVEIRVIDFLKTELGKQGT